MSNPMQQREYKEIWDERIEKFAELIIEECAQVAANQVMDAEGNDWGVRYAVEKHFGVENEDRPTTNS